MFLILTAALYTIIFVYHLTFQNYDEILIYRRKAILLLGSISLKMCINQEWIEVSDISVQVTPLYLRAPHPQI